MEDTKMATLDREVRQSYFSEEDIDFKGPSNYEGQWFDWNREVPVISRTNSNTLAITDWEGV
jgi:hypothetical protein